MNNTELRMEFLDRWKVLTDKTAELRAAVLGDAGLPLWVYGHPDDASAARQAVADVLGDYFYGDDQGPTESRKLAALVGASPRTINAAVAVNKLREAIAEILGELDRRVTERFDADTGRSETVNLKRDVLKSAGLSRLHHRQAVRQIKALSERPLQVRFTWASTSSVKRLTKQQVRERLERLGDDPGIQAQLDRLDTVPDDEPLAYVNPVPLHFRANVVWLVEGRREPQQLKTSLPILVPVEGGQPLPALKPLGDPAERGDRRPRSVLRIESEPFLASVKVHRYLDRAGRWVQVRSPAGGG